VRALFRARRWLALSLSAALFAGAPSVAATYSLAAVDVTAGQVGAAGTSCLGGADVAIIYRAVPARGVVIAQAHYDAGAHQRAVELFAEGKTPAEVLEAVAHGGDDSSPWRQFAVLDLQGRVATFTGARADPVAGDLQGQAGSLHYSAQGNLLTSERVLTQAAEALLEPACDLTERLLRALEAGGRDGNGDRRCTELGIPSDSAFVRVEAAGGDPVASLVVASSGSANPLLQLRALYESYRAAHPCAKPRAAATTRGSEGGCSTSSSSSAPPLVGLGLLSFGLLRWRRRRTLR
jgi:uncharacterized protein (TIGR03382 family)